MKSRSSIPLLAWSVRDLSRYPLETALLFLAIFALVAILGTALLLSQALSTTASLILKDSPAVVVRRVNPVGWSALPAQESIRLAQSVPGVLYAGARIWGVASSPGGTVTVFGFDGSNRLDGFPKNVPVPKRGEAVIGAGVRMAGDPDFIELSGHDTLTLKIIKVLNAKTSIVAHDLVLINPADARKLCGIAEGFASDLTIEVFHEAEAEAILPDLAKVFPWPVQMTTRSEAIGIYTSAATRRGGIVYIAILPGILALALIIVGVVKGQMVQSCNVGLYKALGWTTNNIFQMQLLKALVVGIPAVSIGMLVSYALVFWPGASWPGHLFFGWDESAPQLFLNASGALLVLIEMVALVFFPYLTAALWPILRASIADPQDLLESN
jgi:hypothetical protein